MINWKSLSIDAVRRALLISGTLPGHGGVGEIVLQDALAAVKEVEVRGWGLVPWWGAPLTDAQERFVLGVSARRFETAYRPLSGIVGEVCAWGTRRILTAWQEARMGRQILSAARQWSPDTVWAILDCPTAINLSLRITDGLAVPLIALVWDAPEVLAAQLGFDRWSRKCLLQRFDEVLRRAERIAVPGESMAEHYRSRYGDKVLILRHGLPELRPVSAAALTRDSANFVIGFAGSLTAPDAFGVLLESLRQCDWQCGGRQIVLRIAGARLQLSPSGPQRIEYYGRLKSVDETVTLLAGCNVLYLPQPFVEDSRLLAELSFPTKLSTYVAARRPIMLHAPSYASLGPFWQRFPMGPWCHSASPRALTQTLDGLIGSSSEQAAAVVAVDRAAREELNHDRFVQQCCTFLSGSPA